MNYRTFQHLLKMVAGVFVCEVLSANLRMCNVEIDRVSILQILIKPVFRSFLFCVCCINKETFAWRILGFNHQISY